MSNESYQKTVRDDILTDILMDFSLLMQKNDLMKEGVKLSDIISSIDQLKETPGLSQYIHERFCCEHSVKPCKAALHLATFNCRCCQGTDIKRNGIGDLWDYPFCEGCQEENDQRITRFDQGEFPK